MKKLVYLDGQQAVPYRSWMNPFLGRNFEALDPLEWLARMSDHIPGFRRTLDVRLAVRQAWPVWLPELPPPPSGNSPKPGAAGASQASTGRR